MRIHWCFPVIFIYRNLMLLLVGFSSNCKMFWFRLHCVGITFPRLIVMRDKQSKYDSIMIYFKNNVFLYCGVKYTWFSTRERDYKSYGINHITISVDKIQIYGIGGASASWILASSGLEEANTSSRIDATASFSSSLRASIRSELAFKCKKCKIRI